MTKRSWAFAGLLVLAAVLIIVGIVTGQPGQVLSKAAKICLECVGIG